MARHAPEVEAWLVARALPLDDAVRLVRDIVLEADPRIEECIKWSTPTYTYKGNLFSFNPAKKLVSLLFHRGAEIPGEHARLEGEGKLARTMRFADIAEVEAGRADLERVVRAWCDWRDG
jgi:hypothetical protein